MRCAVLLAVLSAGCSGYQLEPFWQVEVDQGRRLGVDWGPERLIYDQETDVGVVAGFRVVPPLRLHRDTVAELRSLIELPREREAAPQNAHNAQNHDPNKDSAGSADSAGAAGPDAPAPPSPEPTAEDPRDVGDRVTDAAVQFDHFRTSTQVALAAMVLVVVIVFRRQIAALLRRVLGR